MNLNFDEMMALCNSKKEFRAKEEFVDDVSVTIFSYMVALSDTFDSELAKEFRGTTFITSTKECICRPFPKFFNVGERPETQKELISWRKAKFYTKHDGSMATPVLINDKVFWKTKNSFFSDVAINIQKFYDNNKHPILGKDHRDAIRRLKHFTPIFEYVGPDNRIVLEYEKEELIYLGFRNIESGEFLPHEDTSNNNITASDIFNMEDIEGFVVHDGNQMVKMKTEWYLERHRIVSDFNPKSIIKATLDESIDDILGVVSQLGMMDRFKEISDLRDETLTEKMYQRYMIEQCWALVKRFSSNRKEFAFKVQQSFPHIKQYIPFMFLMLDGKSYVDKLNKLVYNTVYEKYKPVGTENE